MTYFANRAKSQFERLGKKKMRAMTPGQASVEATQSVLEWPGHVSSGPQQNTGQASVNEGPGHNRANVKLGRATKISPGTAKKGPGHEEKGQGHSKKGARPRGEGPGPPEPILGHLGGGGVQ